MLDSEISVLNFTGYTGYHCEQEIDECWSQPCMYFGMCNDFVNYYTCDCIPGITGYNCEISEKSRTGDL